MPGSRARVMKTTSKAAYNRAWYAAHREEAAAYTAANSEKKAAYDRAYHNAHLEERAACRAVYYAANSERQAARNLKAKFGMTPADRAEMLDQQGGLCAGGCGLPATHIDHCHLCHHVEKRGSVRGILCNTCNAHLDHIARFSSMHADYLAIHAAVCPA